MAGARICTFVLVKQVNWLAARQSDGGGGGERAAEEAVAARSTRVRVLDVSACSTGSHVLALSDTGTLETKPLLALTKPLLAAAAPASLPCLIPVHTRDLEV